jgi:hypothetical protein
MNELYEWELVHEMAPIDEETVYELFTELKEQAALCQLCSEEDDKQTRDRFISTCKWPQVKKDLYEELLTWGGDISLE